MRSTCTLAALSFLGSATGFSAVPPCLGLSPSSARAAVRCDASEEGIFSAQFSRRAALAGFAGVVIGAGASPSWAGYVTSLGIETTTPKDAERDAELLATKAVQDALKGMRGYKAAAQSLKSQFAADNNMQLIATIRKDFDFSKVRDDLNVASSVFDDTTQLTIDRLSRSILYDLTELETASRFKKGEAEVRTPKKVANVEKWFGKLDNDFGLFLAYFA